jgi:RNA polymerase sigma-70 factor (ECF subfamily)
MISSIDRAAARPTASEASVADNETLDILEAPAGRVAWGELSRRAGIERAVILAQNGNRNALDHLIRAFDAAVFRICYRIVGNQARAEEARQETFAAMIQSIKNCQSTARFTTWLLSIATHVALDTSRKGRKDLRVDRLELDQKEALDPLDECIKQEELGRMQEAMQQLTPRMRTLLALRFEEDMSSLEIGAILGVSSGQVRVELHRARIQLRRAIRVREDEKG